MKAPHARPSRRAVLAGGAGGVLALALSASSAQASPTAHSEISEKLRDLEREHNARLGAFGCDTATGNVMRHRADERFAMCSVFKTLAAAAVLRDLDRDGDFLATRIRYTEADTTTAGYAPITGQPENLANGMTVADLCDAAIRFSDNAAANLLLRDLGGPTAITRFCRSIGDGVTRLDRWEPELNFAEPWRLIDTTTPRAIGRTYARLAVGSALCPVDRERLTGWLLGNTTGANRIRAGLPSSWRVADKTGSGRYGTTNDVGIVWPPDRPPIVLAILSTKRDAEAASDEPLVAAAATALAAALT